MPKRKFKKRRKSKDADKLEFDLGESFDVATAKGELDDIELDMDAAAFQGKKGQAGSRTQS